MWCWLSESNLLECSCGMGRADMFDGSVWSSLAICLHPLSYNLLDKRFIALCVYLYLWLKFHFVALSYCLFDQKFIVVTAGDGVLFSSRCTFERREREMLVILDGLGQCRLFCREFTHILAYFLLAQKCCSATPKLTNIERANIKSQQQGSTSMPTSRLISKCQNVSSAWTSNWRHSYGGSQTL